MTRPTHSPYVNSNSRVLHKTGHNENRFKVILITNHQNLLPFMTIFTSKMQHHVRIDVKQLSSDGFTLLQSYAYVIKRDHSLSKCYRLS